jgi:hypothetical protein
MTFPSAAAAALDKQATQDENTPKGTNFTFTVSGLLTAFNLLHNGPSGNALDDCPGPLSNSIQIYFQNVNGVRTSANGLDILDFCCQMKDIDATIFGINEVNQDTQHPYIQQLLHSHLRRVWDNSQMQYASSKLDIGTIRKPSGTLLGVTGSISSRVIHNFSDVMGRWCRITLLGKLAKRYTIICAYQVPLVTGRSGPTTSHTQQLLMLRQAYQENQRPRDHFCKDLQFLLKDRINDDHEITLMGDFNKELGSSTRGFTKVITECNLVDVCAATHGLEEEVRTYARGWKRLNYILMTPSVDSHVTQSGTEPFNHRFFSDHRGIFVDLELKGLFDQNLAPLAQPTCQDIRSGSSRLIQVYINELRTYLLNHKIIEQIDQLAQAQDDGLAEAIEQKITAGMLPAGSKCETAGRLPFSAYGGNEIAL